MLSFPSPCLLLPRRLMPDEILPAVRSADCMDRSEAYAHHFEIEDLHNILKDIIESQFYVSQTTFLVCPTEMRACC